MKVGARYSHVALGQARQEYSEFPCQPRWWVTLCAKSVDDPKRA